MDHLTGDRLGADPLTPDEERHLATCVRCRSSRRLLRAGHEVRPAPASLGRFRLLGRIGAGGMGVVLLAEDPLDGARRAIKVVHAAFRGARARFAREGALQAAARHPHVLPVLEVLALDDGRPALVLPLVEGPSLEALLARDPPPLGQRLALFVSLVAGVAAIHAAGLVHRDLKPGNVLLDPAPDPLRAVVADFGIAKAVGGERLTMTGAVMGSARYMAPEQGRDASRVTPAADLWSLGVILGELLLGERPAPAEIVARVDGADGLPDEWRAVARGLLRVGPGFADACALLAALPTVEPLSAELRAACRALAPVPAPLTTHDLAPVDATDLAAVPHSLPAERDALVGRDESLAALDAAALPAEPDRGSVIALVGPEGIGKTRVALRFATAYQDDHPGGVWWCELGGATSEAALSAAARVGLGLVDDTLEPSSGTGSMEELGRVTAARGACLVVLDGAAVGADAGAALARWIDAAPAATFLVTARAPLGLPGERVVVVPPLGSDAARALFVARAAAVLGAYAPDDAEVVAIDALVERLGRVPRAIERAAERVNLLSPEEMLEA